MLVMYHFPTVLHPHGHRQLPELLENQRDTYAKSNLYPSQLQGLPGFGPNG